jgi:hypothetical protein
MDKRSTDNSIIPRMCWTLSLWLASTLEQAEREAVIGDLAESGDSGNKVLASVLGLVIRRQTVIWKDSHLWVVLFVLVLPFSFLLCTVAQNAAVEGAVYTWMYANNWDWGLIKTGGFWYVLGHAAMQLSLGCLIVACWSWSAGLLLGFLRKDTLPSARVVLLLLLALFQIVNVPQHWFHFWMVLSGVPPLPSIDSNAPVTAIAFYRVGFPFFVLGTLVALPAIWGIRQQAMIAPRKLRPILVFGACVAVITMLLRVPPGLGLLLGASGRQWFWQHRELMQLLPTFSYWPVLYVAAVGLRRFLGRRAALA